ncbi:ABC transporter substrate-binding protein [Thermaurantiacus sp.]|uniref:MlaC/ttg2D family ABC transporter substrate-binding protein n=1 Tax=Thermaurantiacus sp. TaxID=2820283 RepID=UPI00298F2912|nr:ABC transporter substrate-binding protein [Thermaurantiacus sp.]
MRAVAVVAAGLLCTLPVALPAQPASPERRAEAAEFVRRLSDETFAILRNRSLSRDEAKRRFRDLLRANVAVDQVGMRLIRRHRAGLSPQQLAAYRAALPDFIVNTYADRLYDFADSRLVVVRQIPRGSQGDVDVVTRVSDPKGGKPIEAIWLVRPWPDGGWRILNLTVGGVNIALTQEADFDSYIRQHGFDALVDFMRRRG